MHKLLVGNKLRKTVIVVTLFILNSCLTINSQMKINSNGSGTLAVQYQLERGLSGIANLSSSDNIVPLNLSEEHIIQMIGNRSDISYKNYSVSENNKTFNVEVTFVFDNIDALNRILPRENAISLIREGGDTIFRQGIVAQNEKEINDKSLEILKDIYKDHTFTLEVQVPGDIKDVIQGTDIDDRVALYHEQFIDIITSNDKKEWSIRW